MNTDTLVAFIGLAGVVFSTLWASGGWATRERHAIQQEVDIAKSLPPGKSREAVLEDAASRAAIYIWRQQNPPEHFIEYRDFSNIVFGLFLLVAGEFLRGSDPGSSTGLFIVGLGYLSLLMAYVAVYRRHYLRRSKQRADRELRRFLKGAGAPPSQ